jgi:4-amino-4-deoxy-L-arabinose transferase-like glycosyltransferase
MLRRTWRQVSRPSGIGPLLALMLVGAAVRLWALGFGLPHSQARPDESMIIDVVRAFLSGRFNPPFYDYPWLYMYMAAAVQVARAAWGQVTGQFASLSALVASWPAEYEPFFLANRLLSAVFGTLGIAVAYVIGTRVHGRAAGLVSAFFLAVCFLHVRDSHYGTTDVTMTFFVLLAVALLLRAEQEQRLPVWAGVGVAAGLAAGTKYHALPLVVPIVVAQAISLLRRSAEPSRVRWPIVTAGVPFAIVFLLCAPFIYLDWQRFADAMGLLQDWMRAGQTPGSDLGNGWWYHLRLSLRYGLGLPMLVGGLAGAVLVFRRSPMTGLLLLSYPAAYYAVAGASRGMFFRYALPVAPFLCVTAAVAVVDAARFATRGRPRASVPVVTAAALLVAGPSMVSVWHFDRVMAETDNRVLVSRWVEDHVPEGSSILQSGSQYGYAQLSREKYRLWTWDKERLRFVHRGEPAMGRPDWILLQEPPWPGSTQPIVFEFLRSGYQLAWAFPAFDPRARGNVYDTQDAFFVPYAGFRGVERPGPNFKAYRRVDGAPAEAQRAGGDSR